MGEEFFLEPPPKKIFLPYEAPVVEITDSFILAYGEQEFARWLEETFRLKPYMPPVSHEKIQREIEEIVKESGIKNLELRKILISPDYSWGILLTYKLPRPVPIIDENGNEILRLWLTPYERKCYVISDDERYEIDLAELVKHAPRPNLEEFLERIKNYFKEKYSGNNTFYIY
ncbi:MAG TPA: hypothetical protein EYH56_02450 [Nanoarchaeota archaeon]|nr:hypothetical protein [Nanoarchaeota archaeon]